jgi:hypothetical protein
LHRVGYALGALAVILLIARLIRLCLVRTDRRFLGSAVTTLMIAAGLLAVILGVLPVLGIIVIIAGIVAKIARATARVATAK